MSGQNAKKGGGPRVEAGTDLGTERLQDPAYWSQFYKDMGTQFKNDPEEDELFNNAQAGALPFVAKGGSGIQKQASMSAADLEKEDEEFESKWTRLRAANVKFDKVYKGAQAIGGGGGGAGATGDGDDMAAATSGSGSGSGGKSGKAMLSKDKSSSKSKSVVFNGDSNDRDADNSEHEEVAEEAVPSLGGKRAPGAKSGPKDMVSSP